jgi:nucleoside permease NupC
METVNFGVSFVFAFQKLQMVIFFSALNLLLSYLKFLQKIVLALLVDGKNNEKVKVIKFGSCSYRTFKKTASTYPADQSQT